MEHARTPLRPGMTALAAALALTATPLFAQTADPAPAESAPVMISPPPPVMAAPSAAAPTVNAVPPTSSTAATTMAPIVHQPEPAATTAVTRAAPKSTPRAATPVTRTATPKIVATPVPLAVPTAVETPAVVASTRAAPTPVAAPTPAAKATPAPQPVAQSTDDDMLPIAGGIGAAVLLLAGGAFALGRRRRHDADEGIIYETTPETLVEAAPVAVPVAAPRSVPNGSTTLPSGFDISRFGRHTQAAYRGPTPENPSLSLKKRLKVASFYDGRERMAAEGKVSTPLAAPAPFPAPAAAARMTDHITVRPVNLRPNFKPAFSS